MHSDAATSGAHPPDAEVAVSKNHDVYFVPGLQRGLRVLEVIAEARQPLGATAIARQVGVTRSSAFRFPAPRSKSA